MIILQSLGKHFEQIKRGGILVFVKKVISFIYLILQLPIYISSIPLVIIIRLVRPWLLIRWKELRSSRIGHFAKETELYCCKRDAGINSPSQKCIDLFYLKKYVCNKYLEKMWRRSLIILPSWLLIPLFRVNRFINIFVPGGNNHEIENYTIQPRIHNLLEKFKPDPVADIHNLLERFDPHLNFTDDEETRGKKILTDLGLSEDAKFVCLLVRDSGYLNRYKEDENIKRFSYHNYRDGNIDNYVMAVEELARRGYYVFRMGINVLKPLKLSNSKVIDYANLQIRSDFMDIYLGAKCSFCISISAGFDEISHVFRRPLVYTNAVPIYNNDIFHRKSLIITKHHIDKKNKKELTLSEILSSNVAGALRSEEFEKNNIELKENSPEEIRDLVVEMDERLSGNWKETKEDLLFQKKFCFFFEENIEILNSYGKFGPYMKYKFRNSNNKYYIQGKIKARFGAKYLRDNMHYLIQSKMRMQEEIL